MKEGRKKRQDEGRKKEKTKRMEGGRQREGREEDNMKMEGKTGQHEGRAKKKDKTKGGRMKRQDEWRERRQDEEREKLDHWNTTKIKPASQTHHQIGKKKMCLKLKPCD